MSRRHSALRAIALALLVVAITVRGATPAAGDVVVKQGTVDGRAYRPYVPAAEAMLDFLLGRE